MNHSQHIVFFRSAADGVNRTLTPSFTLFHGGREAEFLSNQRKDVVSCPAARKLVKGNKICPFPTKVTNFQGLFSLLSMDKPGEM